MFHTTYTLRTHFMLETSGYGVITTFEMLVETTRILTAHKKILQHEIGYWVLTLSSKKFSPQQQTPFIGKRTLGLPVFSQSNNLLPCNKSFFRS